MTTESAACSQHIVQHGDDLSREDQRRGFRLMLAASIFAVIGGQVFAGNIMQVIAWTLGGKERFLGLLNFLICSSALAQLFIVPLAQASSKKRLVLITLGCAYLATIPTLATQRVSDAMGVTAALALLAGCVFARQISMFIATPSWMGLLREMTPARKRGRLLGWLRTAWQVAIVVILLLVGWYLGKEPGWEKLRGVLILGLLAQVARIVVLLPVPAPPTRRPRRPVSWLQMLLVPVWDPGYRPFLTYLMCLGFAMGLCDPFRIAYLLRLGFKPNLALIATCFTSIGAGATLIFWGTLADRFGNRGVFGLSLGGATVCTLLWLLVGYSTSGLILAMVLFAAGGAFVAGNGLVQTRYMFGSLRPEFDTAYIAVTYFTMGLAVGLASLVSGQILGLSEKLGLAVRAEGGLNAYQLLFITSACVLAVGFRLRRRFREPKEARTIDVLTAITRPLRVMIGPLIFWPHNGDNSDSDLSAGRN